MKGKKEKKLSFANTIRNDQKKYAKKWQNTSEFINDQDGYSWMADIVDKYNKIVEIGCGTGYSTLELAKRGHKVFSIESNVACINATIEKLKENNINYDVIKRGTLTDDGHKYLIEYRDIEKKVNSDVQVYIIEGDILCFMAQKDLNLFQWLANAGPFNGIICWCIGAHYMIGKNRLLDKIQLPIENPALYRNSIQWFLAKMSPAFLSGPSILHYADRVPEDRIQYVLDPDYNYKGKLANDFDLPESQCKITYKKIGDISVAGGVSMCKQDAVFGKPEEINCNDTYLVSASFELTFKEK
jgi:SAM-dependent methyltransferase